jgi:hypothetical protein
MYIKILAFLYVSFYCGTAGSVEFDKNDLQKLFTDKDQREKIDALRSGKTTGEEVTKSEKVSVSGYVTRSSGKSVVWVNNRNTLQKSKIDDVTVYKSSVGRDKKVTIAVDGKTARLKPGEVWYKDSGKIVDNH